MNEPGIARRYARALFEQGISSGLDQKLDEDVELIGESLKGSRELRGLFESPVISKEKKLAVIRELFGSRVQDVTLRFMELLVGKNRESMFPDIVTAYRRQRDIELGVTAAHVRVAHPLDDQARSDLQKRLEDMTGKKIRLELEHQPDLLGGAVIRIGDTVYDGSVSNKLSMLRERLEEAEVSIN